MPALEKSFSNIQFAYGLESHKFLSIDENLLQLLGIPVAGFTVEHLTSKIYEDDRSLLQGFFEQAANGTFKGCAKVRLRNGDKDIWLNITPFLTDGDEGKVLLGNVSDVTPEELNNEAIAKYTHKKNSILIMLAHELRGPLSIAKSLIKVLNNDTVDEAVQAKTGYLSEIIQDSINLIVDLTDREFLDTVGVVLVKKRVDLVQKFNEYIEECRRSAHLTERNFSLTVSKNQIITDIDEAKFMQVVNNLVTNAMKFTVPGGSIAISIEEQPGNVLITFSDDGIGIPQNLLPLIFDQFTAARRLGLNGEPTFGLGLSIVKTILDWHQASIRCESTENQGTTFFITLPA
ncbi:MAG: HAMP domain-containing sensor histidine kinase [Bacteroidota bacterium]